MPIKEEKSYKERQEQEVKNNFSILKKKLPELLSQNDKIGKYALMKQGKVIGCFMSMNDAIDVGNNLYDDKIFSVQKIEASKISLGYLSQ